MTFEEIVRDYLVALHNYIDTATSTGQTTAELSYRPILDSFLRRIAQLYCPDVDIIFEPKSQGHAGRPDWRIYSKNDFGLYGFVEAKGLDPHSPISIEPHRKQIEKYLSTGQCVILTDGLEFIFFDPNAFETAHRHSIVRKPVMQHNDSEPQIDYLLDAKFKDFFKESGCRQCSEEQLIREMAVRASSLAECVLSLSQAPLGSGVSEDENRTIEILHELQATLRLQHDPVLQEPKVFSSFVAQVLCFGLMYAHRILTESTENPTGRYNAIAKFWSDAVYASYADRLVPFKALVAILEVELSPEHETTSQLRCWYDDIRRLLAHVELRDTQRDTPDYHALYERFLTEFDPQTRFDFGAFYTPWELTSFIVGCSGAVIESLYPGRCLFEEGNKIIDPCCGTGTFIEQLVRHSVGGEAVHLVGFEILPAPYALAHYRMAMLNVNGAPDHKIDVVLTNTLSDELAKAEDEHPEGVLYDELRKAKNCAKPPIVLVIGNPPSSDSFGPHSTGSNFRVIDRLLSDFRPPDTSRRTRQNTQKQIGNDFMKFLRWAAEKVLASEMGVLALVVPSTFAAHPTYSHARKWLAGKFSQFWIMDIDRDLRTGARSSSLFATRQGRMLLMATHTGTDPDTNSERLHYTTIADKTKIQKKSFLSVKRSAEEYIALFSNNILDKDLNNMRPKHNDYDTEMYSRFWAIHSANPNAPSDTEKCIFSRHCSGTKLAPTALFVHSSKPLLMRRSMEIADVNKSYSNIKDKWFSGQRKPPAENKLIPDVRQKLGQAALKEESYRRYAFRPFLPMQLLLDSELLRSLASIGGGGTRLRPEVVSAYEHQETIGIAIAPSPIDIGQELHRFATFCWDMPDNDLCSRGNSHVFCSQFPENKPAGTITWDPTPKNNINENLLRTIQEVRPETTSSEIVFYVYATLCSGVLLEAFADAYFTASATENIPRIPIVRDVELMEVLIAKGKQLAELERPNVNVPLLSWAVALKEKYNRPFNLHKFTIDSENGQVCLYSEQRDPELVLTGLPEDILDVMISGYEVISCWLKFHSFPYTRSEFTGSDFHALLQLLSSIDSQNTLIGDIDEVIEKIISSDVDLI